MLRRGCIYVLVLVLGWWGPLSAQDSGRPTVRGAQLRSLIIPGWGQHVLGDHSTARKLVLAETGLWLSLFATLGAADWYEQDYRAFAAIHAGTAYRLKPDDHSDYYYHLGQYDSIHDYNQVQQRERNINGIYPLGEGYDWQWDNTARRERYEDLRRASLIASKAASFIVGGMVVNRAVAAIHMLFLSRLGVTASASWTPLPGGGSISINLSR